MSTVIKTTYFLRAYSNLNFIEGLPGIYKTRMQINKTASSFAVNHFFLSNFGR